MARELEERLSGARIQGGRVFAAGVIFTCERDGDFDLIFWLDPRFPRVECLPSRGRHKLPAGWQVILGTTITSIAQLERDRRLRVELAGGESERTLEYCAFPKPSLVLRDKAGAVLVSVGASPPRAERSPKPFLLDVLDSPRPDDPSMLRGLEDAWLEAALASGRPPWEFIVGLAREVSARRPTAFVVVKEGRPVGVALVDLSAQLKGVTFEPADSLSHASSRFVSDARRVEDAQDERRSALDAARQEHTRLSRTLRELEKDRARQAQHGVLKENADALTAQLSNVKKGQKEITVEGADGPRKVALDPRVRPHEQADRWYQEARRMKRGMEGTQERIDRQNRELAKLGELLRVVEGKLEAEDAKVTKAFAELGRLARKTEKATTSVRVKLPPVRFRRYRSPGGIAIWVGRNNKENDELTLHAAHREDLWFHAQQCPGSHVVLRSHPLGQPPAHVDVLAAAATAAFYSKARTSKKVPVIYTLAKYVRKPRKAAAGMVSVEREKSVMVEPRLCPEWDEPE